MTYRVISAALGALALASTPAAAQTNAKPRGNAADWVSIDDASPEQLAKLKGQDFAMGFTVSVGPDGRSTGCTHRGEDALGREFGALTCQLVMRRSRFIPATDASGNPVAGSWSGKSRWKGDGAY